MSEIEIEQIRANTSKLNAEFLKIQHELKYEWIKIVTYVVATFTAASFFVAKIADKL